MHRPSKTLVALRRSILALALGALPAEMGEAGHPSLVSGRAAPPRARTENQKDFQLRMKQFFDHYLMDKPEPKWMSDGVPQVKKGVE